MFDGLLGVVVQKAPLFMLVAVRCFALILTCPLLSSANVSRVAKVALAGYCAFLVYPSAYGSDWQVSQYAIAQSISTGVFSLEYILLLVGEALIGIITGFYVSIIFSAFSSAGQFFTFQMGFGASEVYDALSQVENPIMGQYFNLVAMLLFLQVEGFQKLFLGGLLRSFQTINAFTLVAAKDTFMQFLLSGLSRLFLDGMLIALPISGTLLLISLTMGILSKAAPQMNLLSEGLPISILVAFFLLAICFPTLANIFINTFSAGLGRLEELLTNVMHQPI